MEPQHRQDPPGGAASRLSDLFDEALPEVYGYLRARVDTPVVAEDLTSATFVQAALELERGRSSSLSVGWLITVARHKLIDHWRHRAVVERSLVVLDGDRVDAVDPWDEVLDQARAHKVLHTLDPQYRGVLTLRYLDDLSVRECAELLERSPSATESLLARARRAFRLAYDQTGGHHA
jgi:RNA polymerase sigma-70 factor (ECF subfamily)